MKKILLLSFLLNITYIFSFELRTIIFSDYYGQIEHTTDYESVRQRNYIRPEISVDFLDYYGAFSLSAEFYYDMFNDEQTPDPFNILLECYFSFYPNWGDIIIGQKYTNKGKADVFSPLNIFNGAYKEVLSLDEAYQGKRPDIGIELKYYITDESSIELYYIPFPRPDYQSRGSLNIIDDNMNLTLDKESDPYLISNPHSIFLNYNLYGYNFDMQFIFAYYTEQGYNYDLSNLNEDTYLTGTVDKQYNKVQTIGAAFSSNIGPFSIVEEVAFNLTEDFYGTDLGIKNSDITLNTQLTKTIFGRTFAQLNMIYQHVFNYDNVTSRFSSLNENELKDMITDVHLQPTDNILFFIGHLHDYFFREKLYLGLNIGFFFSPDVYIAPRCNYRITDNITIESGMDIYTGEYKNKLLEEDLGGDVFYFRVKYEF